VKFPHFAFLASLIGLSACGQSGSAPLNQTVEQQNAVNSKADLKARLQEIAKTSAAGSATVGMQGGIDSLKAENAKLADELTASLKKLESAKKPADVTRIANEMAAKL
jgi:hypothetical protein